MTKFRLAHVATPRIVRDDGTVDVELRAHWHEARRAQAELRFLVDHLGELLEREDPPGRDCTDFGCFDAALALASAQRLADRLAQCRALLDAKVPLETLLGQARGTSP